jgi:hypothetical protein
MADPTKPLPDDPSQPPAVGDKYTQYLAASLRNRTDDELSGQLDRAIKAMDANNKQSPELKFAIDAANQKLNTDITLIKQEMFRRAYERNKK